MSRIHSSRVVILLLLSTSIARGDVSDAVDLLWNVEGYALAEPRVYYHRAARCLQIEGGIPEGAGDPERIARIPSAGGWSRILLDHNERRPAGVCNPYRVLSNLVADDQFVYWVDATGLVRLPSDAHMANEPELLSGLIRADEGNRRAELAVDGGVIYAKTRNFGAVEIWIVDTSDGTTIRRHVIPTGQSVTRFSAASESVYWILDSRLVRMDLSGAPIGGTVANQVSSYYAEGLRRYHVFGGGVRETEYVYYARGSRVYRVDNLTDSQPVLVYSSPRSDAKILGMTSVLRPFGRGYVYIFESAPLTNAGGVFVGRRLGIQRATRAGANVAEVYVQEKDGISDEPSHFTSNHEYIFWQDGGTVRRLRFDAGAVETVSLRATSMEVTQGIQDISNDVPLIEGRRTFVRLHVRSMEFESPAVPGVTATLTGRMPSGHVLATVVPVNSIGTKITVHPSPIRSDLDHAFLFELPLSWTTIDGLELTATVNPYDVPPEDDHSDNTIVERLDFRPSPRLQTRFWLWEYDLGGMTYTPTEANDVFPTYSWIRRVYPLASAPAYASDLSPGFRPYHWVVRDANLGSRVDMSHPECQDLPSDRRTLCASNYAKCRMADIQDSRDDETTIYYGMMVDPPGFFPRGSADGFVSTGPTGPPASSSWDTDSTYGDWYAGHEIAHNLERGHPGAASGPQGCGHVGSDGAFPYPGAKIGSFNHRVWGFDAGDPQSPRRPLSPVQWSDLMSYCDRQWISDYTYNGLYDAIFELAAGDGSGAGAGAGRAARDGALGVYGVIDLETGDANITFMRCHPEQSPRPDNGRGEFVMELVDAEGEVLVGHVFSPDADEDSGGRLAFFGERMPFADGARQVRVVDASGEVVGVKPISAAPPEITSVALEAIPDPSADTTSVAWEATDLDGDALSFDLFFSGDGGASFEPLLLDVTEKRAEVDLSRVGGGSAILRVIASDGVRCAWGDTGVFSLQPRAPHVRIHSPSDGSIFQWSQLVTFLGDAFDPQGDPISGRSLQWLRNGEIFGVGPALSVDSLPVGTHEITLTARNSAGLSSSDTITVIVHDDLETPGPTLSVAPLQIGWQLGQESAAPVSEVLTVTNLGSGALRWVATTDAPWLTLGAEAGVAPEELIVMADPSGVAYGSSVSGDVVLSSEDDPTELITVRVTLTIGSPLAFVDEPDRMTFRRGDANADSRVDVSDAVATLDFLFNGASPPRCEDAADTNDSGVIDISDAVATLGFLFVGGTPPAPPGHESCGDDPTRDSLAPCGGECP